MMMLLSDFAISLVAKIYSLSYLCYKRKRENGYRRTFKHIGKDVHIIGASFSSCSRIDIGDHIYIGPRSIFVGRGGITIADHVIIGPEVMVMSSIHNWKAADWVPYDNSELLKPVTVEKACWIGARAIIMPGVTLGEGCIVGAGAVVTKSCAPGTVLGGNPARPIGQRDMEHYRMCAQNEMFYLKNKIELGLLFEDKAEVIIV